MTLPFSSDDKKRKYTCFCCGVEFKFNEYSAYKEHIIDEHEEGREWIKCPIERCSAPVRDVRSHFKVCHPHEPIPANMQMKVMVWKDFGTKKRKKLKFEEGYLISTKNHGMPMHYRSSYERKIYECLEKLPRVVSYRVEPFYVPYFYGTKHRKYYPDIKVDFVDGAVEIWEVKPSKQTSSKQNRAKWEACVEYCNPRGWKFVVKTEKGIAQLLIESNQE
jgi:hypothetical protein